MSKKKKIDKNKDKTVKSINNNIRSSVRKLNPILKGIVGKKVDIAIKNLQFSEKRITKDIRKTISSAVANAENNKSLIATSTFFPTIALNIGLSFLVLDLTFLFIDLTVLLSWFFLLFFAIIIIF